MGYHGQPTPRLPGALALALRWRLRPLRRAVSGEDEKKRLTELDGVIGYYGVNNFYLYRFRDGRPAVLLPWDVPELKRGWCQ